MPLFQSPDNFASTRAALHFLAQLLSGVANAHAIAHPQFRHLNLAVRPDGLATGNIPLPNGGIAAMRLDVQHKIIVQSSRRFHQEIPLLGRTNANAIAKEFLAAVRDICLPTDIDPSLAPDSLAYDPDNAESRLLEFAHALFEIARPTLV